LKLLLIRVLHPRNKQSYWLVVFSLICHEYFTHYFAHNSQDDHIFIQLNKFLAWHRINHGKVKEMTHGDFYFRRRRFSPKWIFHRKSFKVENNGFYLNDLPLINYIITKWHGYQLTLRVWVGVGMHVGVCECGCGCGCVGVVLGAGVELSFRCIAPTDTHLSWGPCHLVTMSLGDDIIN
jgi:hypothetical protein